MPCHGISAGRFRCPFTSQVVLLANYASATISSLRKTAKAGQDDLQVARSRKVMLAFEQAAHDHDVEAAIACFATDIVIRSPITQRIRFVGIEQAADLFRRVFALISDIRFYETVGEGERTQVIFWRGRVGCHYLEEANLLRMDSEGRISEMTVFMRPLPGVLALAVGLASSLASRHGAPRAWIVGAMLGLIGALYRAGEPVAVGLVRSGVPVPAVERLPGRTSKCTMIPT